MNKDLLGMDNFEDDDDDLFSGGSLSDLFGMFSEKDSDMSEEEKERVKSRFFVDIDTLNQILELELTDARDDWLGGLRW